MSISLVLRRALVVLGVALCAACGRGGDVTITDARITIPPPGMRMSAGYFTLQNGTSQDIEVRGVSSDAFESIGMHETRTENGVSSMHELPTLKVPAGTRVTFEPGGKHLMLFGPKAARPGDDSVTIAFSIASGDGTASTLAATFHAGEAGATHAH
ncbi:MAG TPA: copper chaperone PCu(A)C [Nevskiaceae bacterium]|nr:copper chaperone PCu(A)C [Nevskiaceae bacterium]